MPRHTTRRQQRKANDALLRRRQRERSPSEPPAPSFERLARGLVKRGRASPLILEQPWYGLGAEVAPARYRRRGGER